MFCVKWVAVFFYKKSCNALCCAVYKTDPESTFVASACECGVAVQGDGVFVQVHWLSGYFCRTKHGRDWGKQACPWSFLTKTPGRNYCCIFSCGRDWRGVSCYCERRTLSLSKGAALTMAMERVGSRGTPESP